MIVGIGIDVCEIARFEAAEQRHPGFARRFLTEDEAGLHLASRAARFAAKEALAKALRIERWLGWHDAEVVTDEFGRPEFHTRGTVAERMRELGANRVHVSLTHDGGVAMAMVVCEA